MFRKSILFWALVAYTVVVCVAILVSGRAHADEATYIDALASDGILVDSAALKLGHTVCAVISMDGVDGVEKSTQAGESAGIAPYAIGIIVADAVNELCPSNIPAVKAYMVQHKSGGWS